MHIHPHSRSQGKRCMATAYCVVHAHTPVCVCNSNACFPVCQSSGSGDDITTQDGSGGLGCEGGAWHGVGRPPSSLSHGSLQKRAAAPEQRLRKRVRGSALLTPLLPHAQPLSAFLLYSLSLPLYAFTLLPELFLLFVLREIPPALFFVLGHLAVSLAYPALFHHHGASSLPRLTEGIRFSLCLQLVISFSVLLWYHWHFKIIFNHVFS